MKYSALALGLVVLSCSACGNDPSEVFVGAGGGSSSSSGNGGAGGEIITEPQDLVFPGTLATYPLAVTAKGDAWLWTGEYVSQGPNYPGDWLHARLRKINAQFGAQFDETLDADGYFVEPVAIHADVEGNVVFVGHVQRETNAAQTMNIGGKPVEFPYSYAAFIAKLDTEGKLLWAKVFDANVGQDGNGSPGMLRFADIGIDQLGRVYAGILLQGTTDLGGGSITHDDALVLLLGPQGDYLGERLLSSEDTVFLKIEVEPSGMMWVARSSLYSQSRVEKFEGLNVKISNKAWSMCWVDAMAFAADGQGGFFTAWGEDPSEQCSPMTVEHVTNLSVSNWQINDGNYYAVQPALVSHAPGHAWLSVGLDGTMGNMTGKNIDDILLAEIDTQGNIGKMQTFGGPGRDEVVQMGVDPSGTRFLTGYFAESIDFGTGELKNTSGKPRAIFLTHLAP
jgi:hypothetical protein